MDSERSHSPLESAELIGSAASATEDYRERIPPEHRPRIDHLVIEDDEPVDNIFAEKQHRLLTEAVTSAWRFLDPSRILQAFANVGLFYGQNEPPLAPDVMFGLDARVGADLKRQENRAYFIWEVGRHPDVAIEFVSDRCGREGDFKLDRYARIGIPYYVLFDPLNRLGGGVLRSYQVQGRSDVELTDHRYEDLGYASRSGKAILKGTPSNGCAGRVWMAHCSRPAMKKLWPRVRVPSKRSVRSRKKGNVPARNANARTKRCAN